MTSIKTAMTLLCHGCFLIGSGTVNEIFAKFISSSHHNMHRRMLTEFHKKGVHKMTVDIGRIYDNKDNTDAYRILVRAVWPRGI